MKSLAWFVGVLVQLVGLQLAQYTGSGWRWVWVIALVLWILYGIGLAVASLVRAAAKRGLGSLRIPKSPTKEGE